MKNDKIALIDTSANRDEARTRTRFDITRSPNEHLAFGVGEHFCLGSSLARLEIRLLFEAMAERMTSIEQAGDVRRLRSNFIAGIKTLLIGLRARTVTSSPKAEAMASADISSPRHCSRALR